MTSRKHQKIIQNLNDTSVENFDDKKKGNGFLYFII